MDGSFIESPKPTEFIQIDKQVQTLQCLTDRERQRFGEDINDGYVYLKARPQDRPVCAFLRETDKVVDQSPFSEDITQIGLVPIGGELINSHLHNFLEEILRQEEKSNVGIIFLVNDNREDTRIKIGIEYGKHDELPAKVAENRLTAQFLASLVQGNIAAIESSGIPDQYKDLAKKVIQAGYHRNIRYDYVGSIESGMLNTPHWGLLRTYLIDLSRVFKNQTHKDENIILLPLDIDVTLYADHFKKLKSWYDENPDRQVNVAEWRLGLSSFEGDDQTITADLVRTRDLFRAHQYAIEINSILFGKYRENTYCISARLSFFLNPDQHGVTPRNVLYGYSHDEDYYLTEYLRRSLGSTLGHYGEVQLSDRARKSSFMGNLTGMHESDAQYRYDFIADFRANRLRLYKINPEFEKAFEAAEWRDKKDMNPKSSDYAPFPGGLEEYLRHTMHLISKTFLGGVDINNNEEFLTLIERERQMESDQNKDEFYDPQLIEQIITLRALKSFLLLRNFLLEI